MATINHHTHHNTSPYAATQTSVPRRRHSLDYSSSLSPRRRRSLDCSSSLSSLLKQPPHHHHHPNPNTISLSSHMITSISATTTTTPTTSPDTAFSLDALQRHLASADFRQADEETRRLLIVLAGEAAIKRGYVFFSEVKFIPKEDLKAIDELWLKFSNGRFGYSVQKKIWLKVDKDFSRFFMKVGWMKKLDTEIEQYNYRAFPNEFMWELNVNDDQSGSSNSNNNNDNDGNKPPEGHLPLTNALRGTQLLNCILSHPAFYDEDDDGSDKVEDDVQGVVDNNDKKKSRFASLRDKFFKPNYTF